MYSIKLYLSESLNWNINNISIEPLNQGLSNKNYILYYLSKKYFLRIISNTYTSKSINRDIELANLTLAYTISLTPKVVHFNPNNGYLITDWISGHMPTLEEYNSSNFMFNLTTNLKNLHKLKGNNYFDPFKDIYSRISYCKINNRYLPKEINSILIHIKNIESILKKELYLGFCHNDINVSNMIINNNQLYFIDFEYSGMGDIFFDLATIYWMLNKNLIVELLTNYFGCFKTKDSLKLKLYLYIVKVWNLSWCLCQPLKSNYDFRKSIDILIKEVSI